MKRLKYNRRFVNVVVGFGKKRGACLRAASMAMLHRLPADALVVPLSPACLHH